MRVRLLGPVDVIVAGAPRVVSGLPCNGGPAQRWYELLIFGNETQG